MSSSPDAAARARDWHHARQATACDVLERWAHGTVVRATRYPDYFDLNVLRVEDYPAMSMDALVAFADQALFGLAHRRVDFDHIDAAEPLRARFEAEGWRAVRLLWMRHDIAPPRGPEIRVEHVPYDAVHDLRVAWHREDFPHQEPGAFLTQAHELALGHDVQVLAVIERGAALAFAQLERDDAAAEIAQVYVHPEHRGRGLGTALTRAAIDSAGDVRDLWIAADEEDRPKQLYARLGFRPAWTAMEFLRPP